MLMPQRQVSSIIERPDVWGALVQILRDCAAAFADADSPATAGENCQKDTGGSSAAGLHVADPEEAYFACRLLNQCSYSSECRRERWDGMQVFAAACWVSSPRTLS